MPETNFPKSFNRCPNPECLSGKGIAELESENEVKKGNLAKGMRVPIIAIQSPIFNPQEKSILIVKRQIPIILCLFDVCSECGTMFCYQAGHQMGMIQPQVQQQPGDNHIPSFFGKG